MFLALIQSSDATYNSNQFPKILSSSTISNSTNQQNNNNNNSNHLPGSSSNNIMNENQIKNNNSTRLNQTSTTTTQSVRINDKLHLFPQKILSKRVDGIIYEGIYYDNGMEYQVSIKEIKYPFLGSDELTKQSLFETQHRNIIKYHTVYFKKDKAYIVMDLHTKTLESFIRDDYLKLKSNDNILTPLCKSLFYQLCNVLVFLQTEVNIAHCDLQVSLFFFFIILFDFKNC